MLRSKSALHRQHLGADMSSTVGGNLSRSSSKSSVENSDDSERSYKSSNAWVPPNDRELIIRAKLRTGWSSRLSGAQNQLNQQSTLGVSNHQSRKESGSITMNSRKLSVSRSGGFASTSPSSQTNSSGSHTNMPISDAEFIEIEHVLKRANMVEQKELDRISKLFQRYQAMNRPRGNGETTCYICNCNFGILGATPRICADCLKNVCQTCSIDSLSLNKQSTIWLCRICAEYRDFLKKSGVWFSKRLPLTVGNQGSQTSTGITPSNSNSNSFKSDEVKFTQKQSEQHREKKLSHRHSGGETESDEAYDEEVEEVETTNNPFLSSPKKPHHPKHSRHESTSRSSMHNHNRSDLEDDEDDDETNTSRNRSDSAALSSTSASNDKKLSRASQCKSPTSLLSNEAQKSNEFDKFESEDMFKKEEITTQASKFNENLTNFDPNVESKLMHDQIANLRNVSIANVANSTAISAFGSTVPAFKASGSLADNNNNRLIAKPLHTASTPHNASTSNNVDDSLSNLSLAFNAYRPTRTSNSNLGHLQFTVEYIPSQLQLKIDLIGATDLPPKDSNGLSDPYVKLHLLPGIAKATKLRSKTIYKNLNPHFNETFHYDGVTVQDLDSKTLRLTVLDEDKFGFDFIGEYRLPLKTLINNEVNHFNVALEEKVKNDDESDLTFRGKINFALKYSKQNNCLFVKINRCTQLLPMDNGKSSDPFVEISLFPSLKEGKSKFKTTVKKKTLDPEFFEEFKFTNVDLRSLLTKTIEICVWDKDFRKNDFIGLVQLGQNRTGDELKHFFTMIKNPELYHEQWHTLHLRSIEGSSDSF